MSKNEKCERGSTNVFKDLGFKNAEEMQAKAVLASRIITIIEQEKWSQQEAADKLGLKQPKISLLCRGQLSGFSLGKLISLLNKLNQDIEIIIKKRSISKNKKYNIGHVQVLYHG
ncbi:MAG TPA: helix-turn-helix transcriptional regulator [Gammaproteobacteria bacterium]|nr:helix-turn-helix transcriptional regulator [Gammaproteobacteria bacterium]